MKSDVQFVKRSLAIKEDFAEILAKDFKVVEHLKCRFCDYVAACEYHNEQIFIIFEYNLNVRSFYDNK